MDNGQSRKAIHVSALILNVRGHQNDNMDGSYYLHSNLLLHMRCIFLMNIYKYFFSVCLLNVMCLWCMERITHVT